MPKDKTENHEKIIAAAYEEFLKYGFKDASMRRIASACGMSASGLYKHFPSKEDMFIALVEPAFNGLKELCYSAMNAELSELGTQSTEALWDQNGESEMVIEYIYDHFKAFKLLVCCSQGTRYEDYTHDLAKIEAETSAIYFKKMKDMGLAITTIPENEYHILVTSNIGALFQPIAHDFTRKEAIAYARHLDIFYTAGWKELLKIR